MPRRGRSAPAARWRSAKDEEAVIQVDQTFGARWARETAFGPGEHSRSPPNSRTPPNSRLLHRSSTPSNRGRNVWDRLHRAKTACGAIRRLEPAFTDDTFDSLASTSKISASTSKISLGGLDGMFSRSAWSLPGCDDMTSDEKREWIRALREAGHSFPHLKSCARSSILQNPASRYSAVTPRTRSLLDEPKIFSSNPSGLGSSDPSIDFEHLGAHLSGGPHSPILGCDMAADAEEKRRWIREMHFASQAWPQGLASRALGRTFPPWPPRDSTPSRSHPEIPRRDDDLSPSPYITEDIPVHRRTHLSAASTERGNSPTSSTAQIASSPPPRPLAGSSASPGPLAGSSASPGPLAVPLEATRLSLMVIVDKFMKDMNWRGSFTDVIDRACAELGVAPEGMNLMERARACYSVAYGPESPSPSTVAPPLQEELPQPVGPLLQVPLSVAATLQQRMPASPAPEVDVPPVQGELVVHEAAAGGAAGGARSAMIEAADSYYQGPFVRGVF